MKHRRTLRVVSHKQMVAYASPAPDASSGRARERPASSTTRPQAANLFLIRALGRCSLLFDPGVCLGWLESACGADFPGEELAGLQVELPFALGELGGGGVLGLLADSVPDDLRELEQFAPGELRLSLPQTLLPAFLAAAACLAQCLLHAQQVGVGGERAEPLASVGERERDEETLVEFEYDDLLLGALDGSALAGCYPACSVHAVDD